jgi:hypothetical protein
LVTLDRTAAKAVAGRRVGITNRKGEHRCSRFSRCSKQAYLSELVSFVAALIVAEPFYKFHACWRPGRSQTWFVLGAIVHTVVGWIC